MEKRDQVTMTVHDEDPSHLRLSLAGRLDLHTTSTIWQRCLALQEKYKPHKLIIDAEQIDYCDGAGIGLFQTLQKLQSQIDHQCIIRNLQTRFKKLLDLANKPSTEKEEILLDEDNRFRAHIGYFTVSVLKNICYNIMFLGVLSYQIVQTLLHPKNLRWQDMWKTAEDVGPQALPIIILIGFLIGLISTFQAAPSFGEFGVQIYLVDLVSLGLVREMGPLMTAVLLAGRTASSFAAEIGTMKINQEVDALTTMGLNPIKFLTLPRVIATILMTPVLNVFLVFSGLIGCALVIKTLGYPLSSFFTKLHSAIDLKDCIGGIVKVFAFGLVIASVGCLHGLKTLTGARSVGHSTTQAVVSSIIMVVIVDGIFASIYYVLGV